ncbi:hypothetical protein [Dictyobacter kobayashii]|uniref:hypothetical protein n=1 Tax=Dictyobacter kobayashii TaxID=2014872 RepID=UPI000F826404|nr:hypothetical protein [Dictyobacter kobayashii]
MSSTEKTAQQQYRGKQGALDWRSRLSPPLDQIGKAAQTDSDPASAIAGLVEVGATAAARQR